MRGSPGCHSLKNPYFSVSGKMSVQRTKIIGERTGPLNPLTGKRGRSSGEFLFKNQLILPFSTLFQGTAGYFFIMDKDLPTFRI